MCVNGRLEGLHAGRMVKAGATEEPHHLGLNFTSMVGRLQSRHPTLLWSLTGPTKGRAASATRHSAQRGTVHDMMKR